MVANHIGDTLSLMAGDGAGGFTAPVSLDVGKDPRWITLEDLDGDSDLDLVVISHVDDQVQTYLGAGDGSFTAAGATPRR